MSFFCLDMFDTQTQERKTDLSFGQNPHHKSHNGRLDSAVPGECQSQLEQLIAADSTLRDEGTSEDKPLLM